MANEVASMLTETAFVLPGTKLKIPRWAVLATLGGVIVIVLLAKKQGATIGTTEEDTGEEEAAPGGADWSSFLEKLMEELNQWQGPVAPPAPLEDGGYTYAPPPEDRTTTTGPHAEPWTVTAAWESVHDIMPEAEPIYGPLQVYRPAGAAAVSEAAPGATTSHPSYLPTPAQTPAAAPAAVPTVAPLYGYAQHAGMDQQ